MVCAPYILNPSLPQGQEAERNRHGFPVDPVHTDLRVFTALAWTGTGLSARGHLYVDFPVNTVPAFSLYRSLSELTAGVQITACAIKRTRVEP